jgi:hypothetical protein
MGGPDMAPHTPQTLGAPRRSRGAPRTPAGSVLLCAPLLLIHPVTEDHRGARAGPVVLAFSR